MLKTLIKRIPVNNAELFAVSSGNRLKMAEFKGEVQIFEKQQLIPVLGQMKEGVKSVHASFVVADDVEYTCREAFDLINALSIFDAVGECSGETVHFYGLEFTDNDPIAGELTFEIRDLRLVERLINQK